MLKKFLFTLLTFTPVLSSAQLVPLEEAAGKALGATTQTGVVTNATRSAVEYVAAAQMHARPYIPKPAVNPVQTAGQVSSVQISAPVRPTTATNNFPILQIPPFPFSKKAREDRNIREVISAIRNTKPVPLLPASATPSRFPEADALWQKLLSTGDRETFFLTDFPSSTLAAFPDKMNPYQIAEAQYFYKSYLKRPYNFADHTNFLTSMIMLAYLGKPGDGSGKAIAQFISTYDVSPEGSQETQTMWKNAGNVYQALGDYLRERDSDLRTPAGSEDEKLATEKKRIAHQAQITDQLEARSNALIGLYPYMTHLIGARCLLMLEEYNLINHTMHYLNKVAAAAPREFSYLISDNVWRKIMPYMELEYFLNHTDHDWPLSFPQWRMENLRFPSLYHRSLENEKLFRFINNKNTPLIEKVVGENYMLHGWERPLEAKEHFIPGRFIDGDNGGSLYRPHFNFTDTSFYYSKGYKKDAPAEYAPFFPIELVTSAQAEEAIEKVAGKSLAELSSDEIVEVYFVTLPNAREWLSHPEKINPKLRRETAGFYLNFLLSRESGAPDAEKRTLFLMRLEAMTMLGILGEKGDPVTISSILYAVKNQFGENPSWLVDYTALMALANLGGEEVGILNLMKFRQEKEKTLTNTDNKAATPGIAWLYTRIFFAYDNGIKQLPIEPPYFAPDSEESMKIAAQELKTAREQTVDFDVTQRLLQLDSRFLKGQNPEGKNIFPPFPMEDIE